MMHAKIFDAGSLEQLGKKKDLTVVTVFFSAVRFDVQKSKFCRGKHILTSKKKGEVRK